MEKGNKIILILGVLTIVAGVFSYYEAASFQKKATQTQGKVVHVLGTSYKIQYFIKDGSEKIYQGSGKTHGFREGNTVDIWYRIDKPNRIRFSDGRKRSKTIIIVGSFCILLGIYPLFQRMRNNSTASN